MERIGEVVFIRLLTLMMCLRENDDGVAGIAA